jgi:hypothetical protein
MSFYPSLMFSQINNETIENIIANEMDSIRKGSIKTNDYNFIGINETHLLDFLKKYENDINERVHFTTQILKSKLAMQSSDSIIRQRVVNDLVNEVEDKRASIVQYALRKLLTFKEIDFSKRSREKLITIFNKKNYTHDFILVCGIAQVKDLIPQLKKLASTIDRTKEEWYSSTSWYACLALIRMNDKEKLDNIIAAVELELSSSIRVTRLLKFIAYTKQYDCIKLINKYLMSTDYLPSIRDEGKGIDFKQYALAYLVTYMDDFPVKSDIIGSYKIEDFEKAQLFLNNYLAKMQIIKLPIHLV